MHQCILILAGGAGTRLWPLSRNHRPKQFQAFTSDQTLLQHMVELAAQIVPMERIFIMATPEFRDIIFEQVPKLRSENLLYEPARRDTGPAMVLGMTQIAHRYPDASVGILWSDHLIQEPQNFAKALSACFQACEQFPDALLTVGANPTSPDTGLGYIQMGKEVTQFDDVPVFKVRAFIEKPDKAKAIQFVNSWDYLWNVGYKVMGAAQFVAAFKKLQPELNGLVETLEISAHDPKTIDETYAKFPKQSIEYLFTQQYGNIMVVPADIGWSDIGNWNTLHDVLKEQDQEHLVTRGDVVSVDSRNSLIMAKDRPIAIVGIEDLVVVDDGDVILVMAKDRAQDVKKITEELKNRHASLL
jgi:mannose-1-phosphate guanylyltransferase